MAHYFPYDVKLGLLAHSQSFLANQKARNAIVGAENLLITNSLQEEVEKVDIIPAIRSDHSAITLHINGIENTT